MHLYIVIVWLKLCFGWPDIAPLQIDEFIVLPVDAKVDNAKRVLDKHLK